MNKKRALAYLILNLIVIFLISFQGALSQELNPNNLVLTVYSDGFVFVNYDLKIDPTFPTINITVFGQVLKDLLVLDENGLPLDYSLTNSTLNVYSLGTNEISISYLTQDLTSKDGRYWTLALNSPISAQIIMPLEAKIISMNKVPEMIDTSNEKVTLLMNSGLIEVTYVVGIVGTEEYAQIVLNDAETTILEIKNSSIILTEAEAKLQEAEHAFSFGNYVETETLATEAKSLAILANQTANQARNKIIQVENAILDAQNQRNDSSIYNTQNLLDQAKDAYDLGDYNQALNFANQAMFEIENFSYLTIEKFPLLVIVGGIMISAVVVSGFSYFYLNSRKEGQEQNKKKRRIDSDKIFRQHKDLISEEKEAIKFLVNNNGEAFEAELYDFVKLPRTTTWRMVKRLKRMGIITVSKFRRQNLVRLKTKYDMKE